MILANESVGAKAAALVAAGRALGGSFTLLFKIAGDRNDEAAMRDMGARAKRAGQDLVDQGFWVMPDGDSVPEPVLVAFSSQTAMRVSGFPLSSCSGALVEGLTGVSCACCVQYNAFFGFQGKPGPAAQAKLDLCPGTTPVRNAEDLPVRQRLQQSRRGGPAGRAQSQLCRPAPRQACFPPDVVALLAHVADKAVALYEIDARVNKDRCGEKIIGWFSPADGDDCFVKNHLGARLPLPPLAFRCVRCQPGWWCSPPML